MRTFLFICVFASCTVFGQSRPAFVEQMATDSVYAFEGSKEAEFKDNALFIKFTGNPEILKDSIVANHTKTLTEITDTKYGVVLKKVIKPYWVYGYYEVHVEITRGAAYSIVEIYHKAYDKDGNYFMVVAKPFYQKIVESVL